MFYVSIYMCYYCLEYGFAPAYLFKLLHPYQLLSRSDRSANAYLPGAFCPCIRLEKLGDRGGVHIQMDNVISQKYMADKEDHKHELCNITCIKHQEYRSKAWWKKVSVPFCVHR